MPMSIKDMLLLLVGLDSEEEGLGGMTRLQKLLFLLAKEKKVEEVEGGFEFVPYKAGPYSSKLYDQLEFLENVGMIESRVAGDALEAEAADISVLSYEDLIEDGAETTDDGKKVDGLGSADAYKERHFKLTKTGLERMAKVASSKENAPIVDAIRETKKTYGKHSLNDLLYYIYTKYPEFTTESEIKDQVLRRGR